MEDEGFLSQDTMKGICGCVCCLFLITGVVLLILGFSSIEATEYGLNYSWLSKTISPEVTMNGLHFIGIGHSFIKFPRTAQTIEFSKNAKANRPPIESRTLDGLEVILEISFQYTLQPQHLYELYNRYGENYKQVLQNVAVHVLTEEATGYTAYNFFTDRSKIKDDFQKNLDLKLGTSVFSNVVFLQLLSVDLPNAFENAIQESEVKKQDIQKAIAELNKVKVEVDTLKKSAFIQKNVTVNYAEGEAEALIKQNEANVLSFTKIQDSQTDSYSKFKSKLALSNDSLLRFIKSRLITENTSNKFILNLESPEPKSLP